MRRPKCSCRRCRTPWTANRVRCSSISAWRQLDLYGTVDVCLCCLDSVNYVTEPAALQQAFDRVHLIPGAGERAYLCSTSIRRKSSRASTETAMCGRTRMCSASWQAAVEDGLCAYQFDIFERGWGKYGHARRRRMRSASIPCWNADRDAGTSRLSAKSKSMGIRNSAPVRGGEDRIYFTARKRD